MTPAIKTVQWITDGRVDDPVFVLSRFKTGLNDLLLLDIKIPEIDGFWLYEELKEMDDKVKVCYLTVSDSY